jgi:predicted component of type VI protein secretion system
MEIALHIAGPGLDVHRRLAPGEPALILGRDTDCAVCLPDPGRNVSRRHLSVWNEGGQLHFHVLSVVNGVHSAGGELPPGARGVLQPGEALGLATYSIVATAAEDTVADPPPAGDVDPWDEFERQAAQLVPGSAAPTMPGTGEDDPFGDWGFHSTFGPGAPGGSLRADALQPAGDLQPFFRGLGLGGQGALTQGELETVGRLTRIALQGLLQAAEAAGEARQDLHSEERTFAEGRELNPLRLDGSLDGKLHYLFGGLAASAGLMPPDRAVAQLATELAGHEQAMGEAVRELARRLVEEFDPEVLKKRLLGGGARIFESARAWEAFSREYAERMGSDPAWLQELLDRHFARAYARALVRAKRNTTGRPGP